MSAIVVKNEPSALSEKPVHGDDNDTVNFPPFPEPTDDDFDEDIGEEEREFYKNKFPDLNAVKNERLHCTACDKHLGCAARNESRMRSHPMLRALMCHTCHSFYNSGEFDKGDDGSELYCRWCGQGGQVYCCSDCPVVFCAKCIKRNFGQSKIREIENTDDWKCFRCTPKWLWDHRAVCWALLRYCDLRNKITYKTQDPKLKQAYIKMCAEDETECCKNKNNKRRERDLKRKAENEANNKKSTVKLEGEAKKIANSVTKLPPAIQVKKFASIHIDDSVSPPKEKKKRPASPKIPPKPIAIKPIPYLPNRMINPIAVTAIPTHKKVRVGPQQNQFPTVRFPPAITYPRMRQKPPQMPVPIMPSFKNYNPPHLMNPINDNINLSLESLTQGLDMAAIANIANNMNNIGSNDDVVCTPDFPLEPLCEVTEENNDDDVECITPAAPAPRNLIKNPPPLAPRIHTSLKDLGTDNIIQMTEDDVTVNEATGGLKFRVDPQTLSSNKMYRLPDGRVFAIHANPSMPGGYSATIVAVTDSNNTTKGATRGSTYAAKLNAVPATPSPTRSKANQTNNSLQSPSTPSILKKPRVSKKKNPVASTNTSTSSVRVCDMKTPVEWYRYNLIDAVDALTYSLSRLEKLKKEASTTFLRSRSVEEMRALHKTLDSLLKTSATRFSEVRDNLNADMKKFVSQKNTTQDISDDDDDVEILNDTTEDPIFIDENSLDSNHANSTNDVDLTGAGSSEHNESGDKTVDIDKNPLDESTSEVNTAKDKEEPASMLKAVLTNKSDQKSDDEQTNAQSKDRSATNSPPAVAPEEINGDIDHGEDNDDKITKKNDEASNDAEIKETNAEKDGDVEKDEDGDDNADKDDDTENITKTDKADESTKNDDEKKTDNDKNENENNEEVSSEESAKQAEKDKTQDDSLEVGDDKSQDADMTDELIENLLKDDNGETSNCMEIPEDFQEP